MKKTEPSPECCVDFAFQRIGGKYKGRILYSIHRKGVLRYGELKKSITGITAKMLTQTLRELENDKLVHRKVFVEVPPKVEYTLTQSGQKLIPFIEYLKDWVVELVASDPGHELHEQHELYGK